MGGESLKGDETPLLCKHAQLTYIDDICVNTKEQHDDPNCDDKVVVG